MGEERFEIDYEAEAVFLDGAWHDREELAARVKASIEKGDYRVARLSSALEQLETALSEGRILALRVSPAEAQAVELAAAARGCSPAALLREALALYLGEQAPPNVIQGEAAEAPAGDFAVGGSAPGAGDPGEGGPLYEAAAPVQAAAPRSVPLAAQPLPPVLEPAPRRSLPSETPAVEDSEFEQRWFGR